MKKKYKVGYTRVSTTKQAEEGYSLEFQKYQIEKYCTDNNMVCEILEDDGYSGRTEERPKYNYLKYLINSQEIDEVIVYKMDRLHRDVSDSSNFINLCITNGVKITSINEQLNFNTAMGRAMSNITSSIAQLESELISERTRNCQLQMAEMNRYPFRLAPYGYIKDEDNYLYENKEEVEVIRYIFSNIGKKKPKKIRKEIKEKYNYELKARKLESIRNNYIFYITGEITVNSEKIKISEPLITNHQLIEEINENNINLKKKYKNIKYEYKYYGKVYYNGVQMAHKSSYGRHKRKYYYYVDKTTGRRISECTIDKLLSNKIIQRKEKYERKRKQIANQFYNHVMGAEEYIEQSLKVRNGLSCEIKKINLLDSGGIRVEYKKEMINGSH